MAIVAGSDYVGVWWDRRGWINVVRSASDLDLRQPNGWALTSQFRSLDHAVALGPRAWLVVKSIGRHQCDFALVEGNADEPMVISRDAQLALIELYATEHQHADALNSTLYCNAVYCALRLQGYSNAPAVPVPTPGGTGRTTS